MARFRLGNASGNPWTSVSPNITAASMADWETHPLTKGFVTKVDADVALSIRGEKWCAMSSGRHVYAMKRKSNKCVLLHRMVAGAKKGEIVDHINGDTLDNRRENLRVTTRAVNALNSGVWKSSTTGVKGVHREKATGKYQAYIGVDRKTVKLGRYATLAEAAAVRARAEGGLAEEYLDG